MESRAASYGFIAATPAVAWLLLKPVGMRFGRFWCCVVLSLCPSARGDDTSAEDLGPAPQFSDADYVPLPARPHKLAVTVTPTNRTESVNLFQTVYRASQGVAIGWNGDRASCIPGTDAQAYSDATVLRVNYFRALAGLPGDVTLSTLWNSECMDAALMMSKQGQLSHSPGTNWACYTASGAEAAGKSNLYLGREGPPAIDGYIDDPGSNNYFVGHRRWILYPPQKVIGSGSIPATGGPAANALWVIGGFASRPSQPAWVAWPPRGYVPYQVMPQSSGRWSFAYAGANFANASVFMSRNGTNVALALEQQLNNQGYADNTIVWIPQGVPVTKPSSDITYTVTVSNVVVSSTARVFTYNVTIIDPDAVVVTPPTLTTRFTNQNSLVLSWPTNSPGFTLQSAYSFSPTSQWAAAGGSPTVQGNEYRVTINVSTNQRFFRLQK